MSLPETEFESVLQFHYRLNPCVLHPRPHSIALADSSYPLIVRPSYVPYVVDFFAISGLFGFLVSATRIIPSPIIFSALDIMSVRLVGSIVNNNLRYCPKKMVLNPSGSRKRSVL